MHHLLLFLLLLMFAFILLCRCCSIAGFDVGILALPLSTHALPFRGLFYPWVLGSSSKNVLLLLPTFGIEIMLNHLVLPYALPKPSPKKFSQLEQFLVLHGSTSSHHNLGNWHLFTAIFPTPSSQYPTKSCELSLSYCRSV